MKNKILITLPNKDIINDLKKLGITNFVYPLDNFCVGIPNSFSFSEIDCDGYIYINRILDNSGIDELKSIKEDILTNKHIKGVIFDDLGVLQVFKDTHLETILYMTHFMCSSKEVNEYLEFVDSVILSTDITVNEIKYIIDNAKKSISLFTFGLVSTMYSRRLLLDNYSKFYNLDKVNPLTINNTNNSFILYENNYGTVLYHDHYLYDKNLLDLNVLYYFYHPIFLSNEEILNVLSNNFDNIKTDTGFLYKETIFKLKSGDE